MAAVLASAVIALAERWWLRWSVSWQLARIRHNEGNVVDERPRLLPESLYVVRLSESGVSCTHPDGTTESVAWADLRRVEIATTDQGPFLPDVFWVLHDSEAGCVIPQGATGEKELVERLQQLTGFRIEAVIEAMSSADNRRFLCWERMNNAEPDRCS